MAPHDGGVQTGRPFPVTLSKESSIAVTCQHLPSDSQSRVTIRHRDEDELALTEFCANSASQECDAFGPKKRRWRAKRCSQTVASMLRRVEASRMKWMASPDAFQPSPASSKRAILPHSTDEVFAARGLKATLSAQQPRPQCALIATNPQNEQSDWQAPDPRNPSRFRGGTGLGRRFTFE